MGSDPLPDAAELWRAIQIYLQHAYPAGRPTATVQQRLDRLAAAGDHPWNDSVIEKMVRGGQTQYGLRLGNAWYPHMKMTLERSPDGSAYMLRVDTHDRHIRPAPGSPEVPAFQKMQERNIKLAADIESEWAEQSLLTFKEYLRRDLEQRTGEAPAV